jgi:hypothetical protein
MTTSLSNAPLPMHAIEVRRRIERLNGFSPDQLTDGMRWLAGYAPEVFDAVLDTVLRCLFPSVTALPPARLARRVTIFRVGCPILRMRGVRKDVPRRGPGRVSKSRAPRDSRRPSQSARLPSKNADYERCRRANLGCTAARGLPITCAPRSSAFPVGVRCRGASRTNTSPERRRGPRTGHRMPRHRRTAGRRSA